MSTEKYTNEQFWKLYEKLPQELKDALFAEETGNNIYDICQRYEIEDNLPEIVDYVGRVLAGVLPPDDFQKTLEETLKINKDTAQKAAREINRFIFYPVKGALEELYKIEIKPPAGMPAPAKPEAEPEAKSEEESPAPSAGDTYREPVE